MGASLHSYGAASAGNAWISKSLIYGIQQLLNDGVKPDEILAAVMWSGIDRKDVFISSNETFNFRSLMSGAGAGANPVNFIDESINGHWESNLVDGYLFGSVGCNFENKRVNDFKRRLIGEFFSNEALAIESYENFLRLQWYCNSHGIKLINQTYMDIMHYPTYSYSDPGACQISLTKSHFKRNIGPLSEMIDFTKWIFWKDSGGLYEYTRDNKLQFNGDDFHPHVDSHAYYARNFLLPAIRERFTDIV